MKLMNPKHPVKSSWIREFGFRFDASPFLSGAVESRKTLEALSVRKDELRSVTAGYNGGIYNGPQFVRNYVDDAKHGVRFLTAGTMLLADLSTLPYLRRRDAHSPKLSHLRLEPGMTLISCSGTIGRTVYCRSEMEGVWGSQDVVKVVPDRSKIPPGYLFAFLSSRFGLPIVTASTYGSIIQHLEPEHIESLPVPRFGKKLEQKVHELVQQAAENRTAAAMQIREASSRFDAVIEGINLTQKSPRISVIASGELQSRMEAGFHDPVVKSIRQTIARKEHRTIDELCERIFLPGIFKRIHIEDENFGAPYFTGASLYRLEPDAKGILSRNTSLFDDVLLKEGTILVQAFGQEGGLTGRPVWIGRFLNGKTTTHMLARLSPISRATAGYLFAFLTSNAGYQQVKVLPFGGSIPHFSEKGIGSVLVPMFDDVSQANISKSVLDALAARDEALEMEQMARSLVEAAIEEKA